MRQRGGELGQPSSAFRTGGRGGEGGGEEKEEERGQLLVKDLSRHNAKRHRVTDRVFSDCDVKSLP